MSVYSDVRSMSSGMLGTAFLFWNGSIIWANGTEYIYYTDVPNTVYDDIAVGAMISHYYRDSTGDTLMMCKGVDFIG